MRYFLLRTDTNAPSLLSALEVRDAATSFWHEIQENGDTCSAMLVAQHVVYQLRDMGLTARVDAADPVPDILISANDDTELRLAWDPMQDGYDYPDSGEDAIMLEEDRRDENELRARNAGIMLERHYNGDAGIEACIIECLEDLMHLTEQCGMSFDDAICQARRNFRAENARTA